MLENLKRAFTPRHTEFRECRRCGTRVEDTTDCPACGSAEVARYDL